MKMFDLDFKSAFYKNCKRRRKKEAKICNSCPFKNWIVIQEAAKEANKGLEITKGEGDY